MGLSSGGYDFQTAFDSSKVATSRLAFLSDKGGKTRCVALGDIYSQTLLAPVHQRLFKYLRLVPMDGTFDQDRQRDRIQRVTATERCIYSLDMTAATDRLPALYEVAVLILTGVLTPDQGLAWFLVVTNRSFTLRKGDKRGSVRYSVGQPMGLLSS